MWPSSCLTVAGRTIAAGQSPPPTLDGVEMTSCYRKRVARRVRARMVAGALILGTPLVALCQTPSNARCDNAAGLFVGSELIPTRSSGTDIGVVDVDSVGRETTKSLTELLAARTTGVSVLRSSGLTGAGSRVTMRGSSGVYAPLHPLLFVDGVRVEDQAHSMGIDIGGQAPSRLDDFSSDEIACAYLLRGPAAAAAYGTDASAGIIHVVTRQPDSVAAFRWRAFAEAGFSSDAGAYPPNFSSTPPAGTEIDYCTRAAASTGNCAPTPMRSFAPLRKIDPFRAAPRALIGGEASGRAFGTPLRYTLMASASTMTGVLEPNDAADGRVRSNFAYQLSPRLAVDGGISFTARRTTLPFTDANLNSVIALSLTGGTADDSVYRSYYEQIKRVSSIETTQQARRYAGRVGMRWNPAPSITVQLGAGEERTTHDEEQNLPLAADDPRSGNYINRHLGQFGSRLVTLDASLAGTFHVKPSVQSITTLGVQRTKVHQLQEQFDTVGFINENIYSIFYRRTQYEAATLGLIATEQLTWADARAVTLGVRRDHIRRQIQLDDRDEFYPFASASWNVARESFFPQSRVLSGLRLRAAYGEVGESRGYDVPENLINFWGSIGGIQATMPKRRPARTAELEVGTDAMLFADRMTLGVSLYRKKTTDGVALVVAPGLFGRATTILGNGAAWSTRGVELTGQLQAITRPTFDATLGVGFTALRSRIDFIDGPEILTPVGRNLVKGAPVSSVWSRPRTVTDRNGDGILTADEISFDGNLVLSGYGEPSRELWLAPTTRLGPWRASAVVDYRGGFAKKNETEGLRCRVYVCRALYDPAASLEDQADAAASSRTSTGIVSDADFVRLREVALSWTLPRSVYRALGAGSTVLTLAGRNLATWTSYSGLDPEVTSAGQLAYGNVESFTLPIPRTFTLRLDIGR